MTQHRLAPSGPFIAGALTQLQPTLLPPPGVLVATRGAHAYYAVPPMMPAPSSWQIVDDPDGSLDGDAITISNVFRQEFAQVIQSGGQPMAFAPLLSPAYVAAGLETPATTLDFVRIGGVWQPVSGSGQLAGSYGVGLSNMIPIGAGFEPLGHIRRFPIWQTGQQAILDLSYVANVTGTALGTVVVEPRLADQSGLVHTFDPIIWQGLSVGDNQLSARRVLTFSVPALDFGYYLQIVAQITADSMTVSGGAASLDFATPISPGP